MIRNTVSALVLAATLFAPVASQASLFHSSENTPASTAPKGKMVKMTLKNRTASPMDLLIEDKAITIAPNGEYALNAAEGTHIYAADKTVKLVVTRDLKDSTASFR